MNLEEMIQHLKIAEAILTNMAGIAEPDSPSLTDYFDSAEVVNRLISHFEILQGAMEKLEESAEQPAPTEPTDRGFTLPPYSFPPMESPLKPPYIATGQPLTVRYTESQIEDQQARY
jgi:hypothetical protein